VLKVNEKENFLFRVVVEQATYFHLRYRRYFIKQQLAREGGMGHEEAKI
jgi:hypothetical protein